MTRRFAAILLFATCLAATWGCVPPQGYGPPPDHSRYGDEQDWDSAEFRAGIGHTFKACERALRRMGISVEDKRLRGDSGSILGEDRHNRAEVRIKLRETRDDRRTVVKVRYGERGDRRFSEHLFDAIDREL